MRKILTILIFCTSFIYKPAPLATLTYYISNAGSTSNTGTSPAFPWPFSKLSTTAFNPGDHILLNDGETFTGPLTINRSGSSGSPIFIGAYGTGANPIITGLTSVTSWTNLGGNIWESTFAVSTLPTLNMVVINGVNTPMGRYPNTGYLVYQGHTGSTAITSSSLTGAPNWTGAEAVVRPYRWKLERDTILSQSGTTINFRSTGNTYTNGYGFFIQNDVRTLDNSINPGVPQGAWYFNPTTKKIRVYSTTLPTNVQVSTVDEVLLNTSAHFVTYDHIDFIGANTELFEIRNSHNVIVQNCSFRFAGRTSIYNNGVISANETMNISNNVFSDNNENAIGFGSYSSVLLIHGNSINNTGMIPGAGNSVGKAVETTGDAILMPGVGSIAEYNTINNTGHIGIKMTQNNNLIARYNYITYFGMTRYDAGGVYSWNQDSVISTSGRLIDHNIIISSNQVSVGIGSDDPSLFGIYLDGNSKNVTVTNNTVSKSLTCGLFILNSGGTIITGNTLYDNGSPAVTSGQLLFKRELPTTSMTLNNMNVRNNIFFSKTTTQPAFTFRNDDNTFTTFGYADSNYYVRPINDNTTVNTAINFTNTSRTLGGWQVYGGQDLHSKKSPVTITNINQLFFAYDSINTPITVTLPAGTWIDVTGATYNTGSDVLQPYTSRVYINTGTNIAPTANAGTDKNITLPTSSVSQTGSGNDPDGTISAYAWSFISGPATGTATPSNAATTTLGGMTVAGTYQYQLKVTDNLGLTGVDTMAVVVNASAPPNLPPVVDAGGNKVITQPTATVTQAGSASDPDGSISSYAWSKTSGPGTFNIVSPTSPTTVINGLTNSGIYQFTLTATDNLGLPGSATATITVNTTAPVAPVANAGSDQSITWPVNSINLTGSGTDADGVIVAYLWSRLSGSGTISNPNSAGTTVTGLGIGVSQFQLQVTDNSGLTAVDTMQVSVGQGSETLSASGTTVTFNTIPQAPIITTSPAGISYSLLINGVSSSVTKAGTYTYTAGNNDPNWIASPISGTFTINKATALINASNASYSYDGLSHPGVATTSPAGLTGVTHSYSSGAAPSAIGTYTDTIRLANANYQATQVVITITITSNPALIFISNYNFIYDASSHNVTVTSPYSYSLVGSPRTNAGSNQVIATITDGVHTGADTQTITVAKANSPLTWNQPNNMPQGSKLTAAILSATSTVPGSFTYDHVIGEVVNSTITVTGTFTPTDQANYNGGTIQRTINVYPVNQFLKFIVVGPNGYIFIYQPILP